MQSSRFKLVLGILAFGAIAGILILAALLSKRQTNEQGNENPPVPTEYIPRVQENISSTLKIISYSPKDGSILSADKQQVFTVTFASPIQPAELAIHLIQRGFGGNPDITLQFFESQSPDKKTVILQPQNLLDPSTSYELHVRDAKTKDELVLANYETDQLKPTAIPQNNTSLQQYLPYETNSYRLSYLPSQNIYVFNFFFDPNSSDDSDVQYEKAKAAATQFIESKGIDINSIVIDWRHS